LAIGLHIGDFKIFSAGSAALEITREYFQSGVNCSFPSEGRHMAALKRYLQSAVEQPSP
jgi:hypothetical protein